MCASSTITKAFIPGSDSIFAISDCSRFFYISIRLRYEFCVSAFFLFSVVFFSFLIVFSNSFLILGAGHCHSPVVSLAINAFLHERHTVAEIMISGACRTYSDAGRWVVLGGVLIRFVASEAHKYVDVFLLLNLIRCDFHVAAIDTVFFGMSYYVYCFEFYFEHMCVRPELDNFHHSQVGVAPVNFVLDFFFYARVHLSANDRSLGFDSRGNPASNPSSPSFFVPLVVSSFWMSCSNSVNMSKPFSQLSVLLMGASIL